MSVVFYCECGGDGDEGRRYGGKGSVVSAVGNDRFTYFYEMPKNGIFLGFMKGDVTRKSSVNHEMRTLWFRILPCILTQSPCGASEGAWF